MSAERAFRVVTDCCRSELPDRPFRAAVLEAIKGVVTFDAYVWVLTDPATAVGVSPLAHIPGLDMRRLRLIIGAKYRTSANRWTTLPVDGCARLADRELSELWRTAVREVPVGDIMSAVLRDRFGCWGFIDLYRYEKPFDERDVSFVQSLLSELTEAQRRRVASLFASAPDAPSRQDPAIILFDDDLAAVSETVAAERSFRRLLPTDPGSSPVPAAAMNASAQLLAREAGVDDGEPRARFHSHDGLWVTVQADRLQNANAAMVATIAVAVDPIGPADRVEVFSRAHGFTPRESEALAELASGTSTRIAARQLGLSEYTLQDHLKAMFAKTSTGSRAELIAFATGAGPH